MIKVTHTAPQKPSSPKPHRMGEGAEGEVARWGAGGEGSGGSRCCSSPLFWIFYLSGFLFFLFHPHFSSPCLFFALTGAVRGRRPLLIRHSNQSFPPPSLGDLLLAFILFIYLLFFFCPRWLKKVLSFFMRSLSLDHRRSEGSPVICCSRPKELTWPGGGGLWGKGGLR